MNKLIGPRFVYYAIVQCICTAGLYTIFDYPEDQLNEYDLNIQDSTDEQISFNCLPITRIPKQSDFKPLAPKDFTMAVYMAADNDLEQYEIRNIRQMTTIGSTESINVVVHLDIKKNHKKICSHFYVSKNDILEFDTGAKIFDSGDPQSLISFMAFVVHNFPARHYMLIFGDHGTGIVDPNSNKIIRPSDLFFYNSETRKLELDRSTDFLDLIFTMDSNQVGYLFRGICWDDSTGHYLTNQKLSYALSTIKEDILGGKKIDIIGFDACLMSMLEVASIIKDYGNIMVGSQEVELGTGWNYQKILTPFLQGSITPGEFAKHIVKTYEKTYSPHTNDFTLSAIDLEYVSDLENNINAIATILVSCLKIQKNSGVKKIISLSRSRRLCTHFETPQYVDLHHLYRNLERHVNSFTFNNEQEGKRLINLLLIKLQEGQKLIEKIVIENVTGRNLSQAKGLSIYFPEQRIHPSYKMIHFAQNAWGTLLSEMVS